MYREYRAVGSGSFRTMEAHYAAIESDGCRLATVKEGNHDEIDGFGDPLLGVLGAWASVPAFAQGTAPDAVKIAPGVYTTPEISAKCQAYAQR